MIRKLLTGLLCALLGAGALASTNVTPTATLFLQVVQVAATPTFSPSSGAPPQTVTISDATAGATIHYTTNGTAPSTSSPVYTSPVTVTVSTTIQAIAVASGYVPSAIGSASYVTAGGSGFIPGNVNGYDALIQVNSSGKIVNGHGNAVQLRGATVSEMENTIYNSTPPGEQCYVGYTSNGGPPFGTAANQWKFNFIRITIDVSAFLNVQGYTVAGSASSPSWAGNTPADPAGNYKNCVLNSILWSRANGMYWLINDHFSAPAFTFGGVKHQIIGVGQPLFSSQDQSYPYWTAGYGGGPGVTDAAGYPSSGLISQLASWMGSAAYNTAHSIPGAGGVVGAAGKYWNANYGGTSGFNDGIFELFNEPQLDHQSLNYNTANLGAGSSVSVPACMLNGCWASAYFTQQQGTGSLYSFGAVGIPGSLYGTSGQPNTTGDPFAFNWWWQVAGYQEMVNGIRALGATNIISISGPSYSTCYSQISQFMPVDPLATGGVRQMSITWHPYGGTYPNTCDANNSYSFNNTQYSLQVVHAVIVGSSSYTANGVNLTGLGYPLPVIASEFGPQNSTSTPDTNVTSLVAWADGNADPNTGTASPGIYSTAEWTFPSAGGPAPFGSSNPGQYGGGWNMIILGPSSTITGSISTTVSSACIPAGCPPTSGILTVTNANGVNLAPANGNQWCITGGASVNSICIYQQLTGTAGGNGTYVVSYGVNQSTTTLTIQQWNCAAGEGCTYYNWTQPHADMLPAGALFAPAANDDEWLRRAA